MSQQTFHYTFIKETIEARRQSRRKRRIKRAVAALAFVVALAAPSPLGAIPHHNPICRFTPSC